MLDDITLFRLLSQAISEFVSRGALPPSHVIKQILSEGIGLGIVAGSCLVKLPQILKLVSSQSAQGLNPVSFEIETFCATVAATYGFVNQLSFNAFGEAVAIGLQNIVLLGLLYKYQGRSFGRKLCVMCIFGLWFAAAQGGYLTASVLDALFDVNSLVLLVSRIPQIAQNYRSKSTGQLSFLTYCMNFMGTLARVFTTLQEKNAGPAMLRGVIMSMVMNAIMVLQIVMYGQKPKSSKAKEL